MGCSPFQINKKKTVTNRVSDFHEVSFRISFQKDVEQARVSWKSPQWVTLYRTGCFPQFSIDLCEIRDRRPPYNTTESLCISWQSAQRKPYLLNNVNEILPFILLLSSEMDKIRNRRCPQTLFNEWLWVKVKFYLRFCINFYLHFLFFTILVKFVREI